MESGTSKFTTELPAHIRESNILLGHLYYGNNRCRGLQESVTGDCTISATFSISVIVKELYRSPQKIFENQLYYQQSQNRNIQSEWFYCTIGQKGRLKITRITQTP